MSDTVRFGHRTRLQPEVFVLHRFLHIFYELYTFRSNSSDSYISHIFLFQQETSSASNSATFNQSRENVRTECDEMSRARIPKLAKRKAYDPGRTDFGLHNFVAPKMKKHAEAHFSHGIAENLDDLKYAHYKYWSNPLETK